MPNRPFPHDGDSRCVTAWTGHMEPLVPLFGGSGIRLGDGSWPATASVKQCFSMTDPHCFRRAGRLVGNCSRDALAGSSGMTGNGISWLSRPAVLDRRRSSGDHFAQHRKPPARKFRGERAADQPVPRSVRSACLAPDNRRQKIEAPAVVVADLDQQLFPGWNRLAKGQPQAAGRDLSQSARQGGAPLVSRAEKANAGRRADSRFDPPIAAAAITSAPRSGCTAIGHEILPPKS